MGETMNTPAEYAWRVFDEDGQMASQATIAKYIGQALADQQEKFEKIVQKHATHHFHEAPGCTPNFTVEGISSCASLLLEEIGALTGDHQIPKR